MKVAITGSSGFIGSHLKERLIKDENEVIEWDLRINKPIQNFDLEGIDYVIHLAAYADVRASIDDPNRYWENNVINTTRIQRMCFDAGVPLLYASSSCIHNWWLSPYGVSKKVNEETAFEGQVGLRFTTVYGKGARDTMLIGRLVNGTAKYLTNHVRDFIHVDDVVEAICVLMSKDIYTLKEAYDIGTGHGVIVSDLGKIADLDVPVKVGDACEALDNTADIEDLKALGWKPTRDVKLYVQANTIGGVPI